MRLAWLLSCIAQAALLSTLWRDGRRDAWVAYLGADLLRSALLWPMAGAEYWWTWALTTPILAVLQFSAVLQAVARVRLRELIHIGVIAGVSVWVWSMVLTGDTWPAARRVPLMFAQGVAFTCFGALSAPLAYGQSTDPWLLAYYGLQSFAVIAAQITFLGQTTAAIHLMCVAALFLGWKYRHKTGEMCLK